MNRQLKTIAMILVSLTIQMVYAADIAVTEECSLAQAIDSANSDEAVGACPSGKGADTIRLTEDIVLDAALPTIDSDITIDGDGFTIDGNEQFQLLTISRNANLTAKNLNLVRASADYGSAIYNRFKGTVTAIGCTFRNNTADAEGGAIMNAYGSVVITGSAFEENAAPVGGAIYNDKGSVIIADSIFQGNTAIASGAIHSVDGDTRIRNSTLSSNEATGEKAVGGAITAFLGSLSIDGSALFGNSGAVGGAIYMEGGEYTLTNSTIGANTARLGGGIYVPYAREATLVHVTLVENVAKEGGGIYDRSSDDSIGTFSLYNSIITGNTGGDCVTAAHENVGSWIGDGSCSATRQGDPMLGEIVATEDGMSIHFPPLENSPLIDSADAAYCTETDQLGVARPQGMNCDIGAIEFAPPAEDA